MVKIFYYYLPCKSTLKDNESIFVQRWATIRKQHVMMVGNGSRLSEAQLAARHAVSMAFRDNVRAACPISPNGNSFNFVSSIMSICLLPHYCERMEK